jgi:hypothetical protein
MMILGKNYESIQGSKASEKSSCGMMHRCYISRRPRGAGDSTRAWLRAVGPCVCVVRDRLASYLLLLTC